MIKFNIRSWETPLITHKYLETHMAITSQLSSLPLLPGSLSIHLFDHSDEFLNDSKISIPLLKTLTSLYLTQSKNATGHPPLRLLRSFSLTHCSIHTGSCCFLGCTRSTLAPDPLSVLPDTPSA